MDAVHQHRLLVSDNLCQSQYRQAIIQTVKPGDIVLDLGTGTGIHAFLCCHAGAEKVYAVEQGEIVELAKEICRVNRLEDRIVFIQGVSSQVEIPEKVDVIVSHLGPRGILSFLIDVRDRFLKNGGVIIPAAIELFCVPLEWPGVYDELIDFWSRDHYGLSFSPARRVAVNEVYGKNFSADRYLAEPMSLGRLDLCKLTKPQMGGEASFHVSRQGVFHGLGVWITLWLNDNIYISTAPPLRLPSPPWSQSFFPVEQPADVQAGDHIAVAMKAFAFTTVGVLWKWEVRVEGQVTKETFTHSTFSGLLLSRESLQKQRPNYVPPLSPRGRAGRLVLNLCDGRTPLSEIEHEVYRQYRNLFRTQNDASAFVAEVLGRYAT